MSLLLYTSRVTGRQHRRQFLVHDRGGRCHEMSQASPIICDQVDRVDINRQQFTNERRVGVRHHDQSGVVEAESQHNRRQPTTHSTSAIKRNGESWVKYARSMRRELLSDAGLDSTIFEQECCTTPRPIT
jgi:hypothetical protein